MKQRSRSAWPVQKVAAAGVSGAFVTLIVWSCTKAGIDMPPDVAAAIVTVGCFVGGYFVPPARGE